MKYHQIESMCRPAGATRGCPHDGLGCTGGEKCSINSRDVRVRSRAYNAGSFGSDFVCQKRERTISRARGMSD